MLVPVLLRQRIYLPEQCELMPLPYEAAYEKIELHYCAGMVKHELSEGMQAGWEMGCLLAKGAILMNGNDDELATTCINGLRLCTTEQLFQCIVFLTGMLIEEWNK